MKNLFNITSFKFHPNACRKVWDTFYFKNKEQIPEKLQRLFESNTGHSDKTRQLHYTLPPTNEDLHGLFEATGKIREDFRKKTSGVEHLDSVDDRLGTSCSKFSNFSDRIRGQYSC